MKGFVVFALLAVCQPIFGDGFESGDTASWSSKLACPTNIGPVTIHADAVAVPDCYDIVQLRPESGTGTTDSLRYLTCSTTRTVILMIDDPRNQVIIWEHTYGNITIAQEHTGLFYLDNTADTMTVLCGPSGSVEVSHSDNGPPPVG